MKRHVALLAVSLSSMVSNQIAHRRRLLPLLIFGPLLVACDSDSGHESLVAPSNPADLIQDGNHNEGNKAFFWLAPMVSNSTYSGVFNAQLKPKVVICELDGDACANGEPIATWTMDTGLTLSTTDEHYGFQWHTDETQTVDGATYRIQVFLTEQQENRLGYADVQLFSGGKELKDINTQESIALQDGRTLPGRFRIEKGASCDAGSDCGEATIGTEGGIITTVSGEAGVRVPAGAVDGDILITIRQVDPASQLWGRCLPTGLRQEEGCYEFDTQPSLAEVNDNSTTENPDGTFNGDGVVVGVCPDPDAQRPEKLTLHKYDDENPTNGVVQLEGAAEDFLQCGGLAQNETSGLFGTFASAAQRFVQPLATMVLGRPLYATDAGRGGVTDAFSFITWAEAIDLSAQDPPTFAAPGAELSPVFHAATAHNHPAGSFLDASGAVLRLEYQDPLGNLTTLPASTTDGAGEAQVGWALTGDRGTHTLTVSTRMEIPIGGVPTIVPDPTGISIFEVDGYDAADDCTNSSDCVVQVVDGDGGVVVTPGGFAGVSIPEGAVDGEILIKVSRIDPNAQPWGDCLPTQIRQAEGCYEFDTEPTLAEVNGNNGTFNYPVNVGVCLDESVLRHDHMTLHKYDPETSAGVTELTEAGAAFLDCDSFQSLSAAGSESFFDQFAAATGRVLQPLSSVLMPRVLYATDAGRGGVTDAFSFIGWAEPVGLFATASTSTAAPGDVVTVDVNAQTAHNHTGHPQTAASNHGLLVEWYKPGGTTEVLFPTAGPTDENGNAQFQWDLTGAADGTHALVVTTRQVVGGNIVIDPTDSADVAVTVETSTTASISGQVTDAAGAALSGAQVLVQGTDNGTLTNDNGFYALQAVQPGTVTLEASMIGYVTATETENAQAGQSYTINFQLQAVGSIQGGVYDQFEEPLLGAEVTIVETGATTTTGTNGGYSFSSIPAGSYTLQADPQVAYLETGQEAVTVTVGGTAFQDFYLLYREGTVSGTATLAGDPAAGLTVTLSGNGVQEVRSTDTQGGFTFEDVLVGSGYTVAAATSGWASDPVAVEVNEDQTTNVTLPLHPLELDQSNTTTDGTTGNDPNGSVFQSFMPTASSLAAVKLRFRADGSYPTSGHTTEVRIREGTWNGTVLSTASVLVTAASGGDAEVLFDLQSPIPINSGSTYFIEWVSEGAPLSWYYSNDDPYQGGSAFTELGAAVTSLDYVFWTYY